MSDTDNTIPQGAMILDPVEARDAQGRDLGIYRHRGVEVKATGEAPPPSEEYLAAQSPELMVKEVSDRITRFERELAEMSGRFDPQTGEAIPRVTGPQRAAMERELATLQHSTLPYTKAQAAEVARAQAALPTAADKLRAEGERRQRIDSRALELAEEQEAQAKADRILRERQSAANPR